MNTIHRGFIVPLLLVIIALLLAGGGAYVYTQTRQMNLPVVGTMPAATSTVQTQNPAGVKTFISQNLGVRFNYDASQGDPVIEEGNTVYVGGKKGQWVRSFTKAPSDDLATAIRKQFLAGISEKDCRVEVTHKSQAVDTAQIAILGFGEPSAANPVVGSIEDPRFMNNPCPSEYRQTNGIRYFWMDKIHSNKFFFFSIGQYAILAEPNQSTDRIKTWQDTFEVIK